MANSNIEWTKKSWNPVTGCTKVSPGCANCYAIRMSNRLQYNPKVKDKYKGTVLSTKGGILNFTGRINMLEETLDIPKSWKKPTRIFVNSMSDLFHEQVSFEFISRVVQVMRACPQHSFQILTKRPQRMKAFCSKLRMPSNVWLGVSVEDQKTAEERIPMLLETPLSPESIRWISAEPLLGSLDLSAFLADLDWVVVGMESGYTNRSFGLEADFLSLVQQCKEAGVPFFMKQLCTQKGKKIPFENFPKDLMIQEYPNYPR